MADITDSIDITTDLNGQGDAVPYHGDAVPMNRQPAPAPTVQQPPADDAKEAPAPSLRDTLTNAFKGEQAPLSQQAVKPAENAGQSENKPDLVKVGDRFH